MERRSGGSDLNVEESPVSAALKRSLSLIWLGGSMSMSMSINFFFFMGDWSFFMGILRVFGSSSFGVWCLNCKQT